MVRIIGVVMLLSALAVPAVSAQESFATIREISGRLGSDTWAESELRRAFAEVPPGQRAAALHVAAEAGGRGVVPLARDLLKETDPATVSAAIRTLAAAWPATPDDAALVRSLVDSSAPEVAAEAMAFAVTAGDTDAVPPLAARLQTTPDDAATQSALVALTGQEGRDGASWLAWHQQEVRRIDHLLTATEPYLAGSEPKQVMIGVSLLLGERGGAAMIAERLLQLQDHADPQVRALVRSALLVNPSVAAASWRAREGEAGAIVRTAPGNEALEAQGSGASKGSTRADPGAGTMAAATTAGAGQSSTWVFVLLAAVGLVAGGWFWLRRDDVVSDSTQPVRATHSKKGKIGVTWAE